MDAFDVCRLLTFLTAGLACYHWYRLRHWRRALPSLFMLLYTLIALNVLAFVTDWLIPYVGRRDFVFMARVLITRSILITGHLLAVWKLRDNQG